MELGDLIAQMEADGQFSMLINSRMAQFGTGQRAYLGPRWLPERTVDENTYTEWAIAFRSVIANAASRHSPVQKRGNMKQASFMVSLADSDAGYELTAPDWETLNRALRRNDSVVGSREVQRIFNIMVVQPLNDHNEKNRWDAVIDEQVILVGDDGYSETITGGYAAAAGYIFNATTTWSNPTTGDPFKDIYTVRDLFAADGRSIVGIVAPTPVISIMQNNPSVYNRANSLRVLPDGTVAQTGGRVSTAGLNALLAEDDLPPITPYNLTYNDESSSHYFHRRNAMTFFASTNQDETIIDPAQDGLPLTELSNILGYTGIGTPSGQSGPGKAYYVESFSNKPPRTEMEGWQTSLPLILNNKGRAVIKAIS
jgi:hypothetical protein